VRVSSGEICSPIAVIYRALNSVERTSSKASGIVKRSAK
jgi:hypothetical protein